MSAQPAATLEEMRRVLAEQPGPDEASVAAVRQRQAELTKPPGSLGRLEDLVAWLAAWQGRARPRVDAPRTAVFAGNHGISAQGVSAYPASVTHEMVQNFIAGGAAVNQLCALVDADLRVYELALDQPTADFSQGPAMSEKDCAHAMAYGMMAVEPGFDILALGEMGIGNTTSAAALCLALFGGEADQWVGRGTGVDDEALARKVALVEQSVALHQSAGDPLSILACLGGLELAAIAGAILAARRAKIPVLLDGYATTAAAATLFAFDATALDHCQVAHVSAEPGHARLLDKIGKTALLNFGMRLGEGSGATLAIPLLQAACACHNGMATFAEARVSGKIR